MHPALNIAIKAARRAGQIINRASNDLDLLKVTAKQPNDFVTEVDKAAEAAIIETLRKPIRATAFWQRSPDDCRQGGRDSEYQWIIDPSTARPISFTACHNMPYRLPWPR
jgi:myo-inositol-1(or 4)-monophosphatase